MKELILKLSEFDCVKIITRNSISFNQADLCCTEVQVYFIDKQRQINIGEQSIGEIFEPLITCLKKAINKNLRLHESLTQNLGFMQNQYYQNKADFFRVAASNDMSSYWVGFDYEICSVSAEAKSYFSAWLYNDIDGKIIFEVTKDYPWHFMELEDNSEDPDFQTYEEFMKDYKPLITRVIPRQVAIEWLNQAMKVYRGLFSTEENYKNMCKELGWEDC
ncbi:hypothetical protein KBC04_03390 [Candidatus Babeliales bacterium]|nr:hypothetical protein [Candidatus Babeliales bacterium]MBP9843904.1 hypothetical protein [Candidatus Babeliales bacterium]